MSSIKVNEEKCIGCGACVAIAPENFDFNDEGLSVVKGDNVTEEAVSAMEACPVCAIEITDAGCNCGNHECHCEDCDCDDCDCDVCDCDCDDNGECHCCDCENCDCDEEE